MIKTEDYFREFVTILFIRRNLILGVTGLFVIGAVLIAFFWPPMYAAKGMVMVKRNRPLTSPGSLEDVQAELSQLREDDLFSEMEVLNSRSVIERTAAGFMAPTDGDNQNDTVDEKKLARLASRIEDNLSVELVPQSTVLRTTLTWPDRNEAKEILETYFDEYLAYRSELYNPREAQVFFQQQLGNFMDALQQREQELIDLAQNGSIFAAGDQIKSNLLIKENLERELTDLRTELASKEAYIQHVQESLKSQDISFFTAIDNMEIGDIGKRLQNLFMEKQELLKIYTDDSPKVKRANEQIQAVFQSLKKEVQGYIDTQNASLEATRKSIEGLEAQMEKMEDRNVSLYASSIRNNRLNREIDLLEESYATFAKRLEEAEISSTTKADTFFNVSILSKPQASRQPIFPQKGKVIPLGLLIGLIVGGTLGFILEFFDHRFKRPEDVIHYAGLPHIYSIPKW